MKQRHKHYDCIVAWAEGEEVEYWDWNTGKWYKTNEPAWYEEIHYRVKPKIVKKEGWVNVYPSYCGSVHRTENEANKSDIGTRVACIRIEWEETLE